MLVYKFMDDRYAIENILLRRIRISNILSLNDPFEFACINLSDERIRKKWKTFKEEISKNFGIVSFCADWKNPLLWAHYANNHTGVCFGIEIPEDKLYKVNYVNERIPQREVLDEQGLPPRSDVINPIFTTKFDHWEYEQEFRWIGDISQKQAENGHHFLMINPPSVFREIIVGWNCRLTRNQITRALGEIYADVEVFRTRPAFRTFEMVRQQNERLAWPFN